MFGHAIEPVQLPVGDVDRSDFGLECTSIFSHQVTRSFLFYVWYSQLLAWATTEVKYPQKKRK